MSNSTFDAETLNSLSEKTLIDSMNEELLKYIIKWCPTSISFGVFWKILCVNVDSRKFDEYLENTLPPNFALNRGKALVNIQCSSPQSNICNVDDFKKHVDFATQQTSFVNNLNVENYFDLDLFFKFVELRRYRNKLLVIFQICVRIKGLNFPKELALKWINSEVLDDMHRIEEGLKLGTFLSDAGWLEESASVFLHTHKIIEKNRLCLGQNLVLIKTMECLTNWLLVTSNFNDFDVAKIVFDNILCIVEKFKEVTRKNLAFTYFTISQHYFQLLNFQQAWLWAVKAINQLDDTSDNVLVLKIISHSIKICSSLGKRNKVKNLNDLIQKYQFNHEEALHVFVETLLDRAWYMFGIKSYLYRPNVRELYVALDYSIHLYGYFNIRTAMVFLYLASVEFDDGIPQRNFTRSINTITQSLYILGKIGAPDVILARPRQLHSFILRHKIKYYNSLPRNPADEVYTQSIFRHKCIILMKMKKTQEKVLDSSIKATDKPTLHTALYYHFMGSLQDFIGHNELSEEFFLKAIKIKESILGLEDPFVASTLNALAKLYVNKFNKYSEAEVLFLRTLKIYEKDSDCLDLNYYNACQGLIAVYNLMNDSLKIEPYVISLRKFELKYREMTVARFLLFKRNDVNVFSLSLFKNMINEN